MSKLYYKGMSLSKYCKINNLKMQRVVYLINKLINDDTTKSTDIEKIIDIAIKLITTEITYKGLSIKEFCIKNEIEYTVIRQQLEYLLCDGKYNELDNESLVELALKSSSDNISVYCYLNGIKLSQFKYRMDKLNKDDRYKDFSYQKKVQLIINRTYNFDSRIVYKYKGIALTTYCSKNKLNYTTIKKRIEKILNMEQYKHTDIERIIEMAINNEVTFEKVVINNQTKYFYKGVSLSKYCQDNNLNYYSIIKNIIRMKNKNSHISIEKIIEYSIKTYHPWYNQEYFYKGIELSEYCRNKNLNYKYVVNKINRARRYSKMNLDDIIKNIVSNYEKFKEKSTLDYSYQGIPFYEFCLKHDFDYNNLRQKINKMYYSEKYQKYSLEEIIEIVVNANFKYKNNQNIRELELTMKNRILNNEEIIAACNLLNVDYDNAINLSNKISINKAINLIWCYGKTNINGKKTIDREKIHEVFEMVKSIKSKTEIDKIEIRDLVKLYKTGLIDTRDILLKRFSSLIYGSVNSASLFYNIYLNDDLKAEFTSQATLYFFESLDTVTELEYNGKIVNYLSKRVRGYVKLYVKDFKETYHMKHLEDELSTGFKLIDTLKGKESNTESQKIDVNKYFSILSNPEITFMKHIYEDNYSYQELANLYKVSVEHIIKKEKELLKKIRKQNLNFKRY